MKARDIIGTAVRSTLRSPLRLALTVLAIFIGAFTLTITSAIGTGVSTYIDAQVHAVGDGNVLSVSKAAVASSGSGPLRYDPNAATTRGDRPGSTVQALTADDIATIRRTSGVVRVDPTVQISPSYIQYGGHGRYQLAVTVNPTISTAQLATGAQLSTGGTVRQILLPTTYVHSLGFASDRDAVGRQVSIGIADYRGVMHAVTADVVGVQDSTLFTQGANVNPALADALQQVQQTGRPASVKTVYQTASATLAASSTPAQVSTVKRLLTKQGYSAQTVADRLGTVQTVINGIVGVLDAFAVIALLAAGFGIVNTLLMSVQERTREIGLMKAMGLGSGRVFALFSVEAIFIGFLGSALGAGVAIVVGTLISHGLSTSLLSALPGLNLLLFAPAGVATIVIVVMLLAFLAGTLPARRAARQDPIAALRYE